jgi:hypothetical protein
MYCKIARLRSKGEMDKSTEAAESLGAKIIIFDVRR